MKCSNVISEDFRYKLTLFAASFVGLVITWSFGGAMYYFCDYIVFDSEFVVDDIPLYIMKGLIIAMSVTATSLIITAIATYAIKQHWYLFILYFIDIPFHMLVIHLIYGRFGQLLSLSFLHLVLLGLSLRYV